MRKLSRILATLVLLTGTLGLHAVVSADGLTTTDTQSQVCQGIGAGGASGDCTSSSGPTVTGVINTVINILSYIVGIATVIMIILSGFKYITAGGDSNKVGNAKTTLTYALIGLVVAVLAQVLVRYVLTKTAPTPTPTTYTCVQSITNSCPK
jgi:hypothetical protein